MSDLASNLLHSSEIWSKVRISLDTRRPQLEKATSLTKIQSQESQTARKSLGEYEESIFRLQYQLKFSFSIRDAIYLRD